MHILLGKGTGRTCYRCHSELVRGPDTLMVCYHGVEFLFHTMSERCVSCHRAVKAELLFMQSLACFLAIQMGSRDIAILKHCIRLFAWSKKTIAQLLGRSSSAVSRWFAVERMPATVDLTPILIRLESMLKSYV